MLLQLHAAPLVASVQASENSPVDNPETLLRLAQASAREGVMVLRLEGKENIRLIRKETGLASIGLIKKKTEGSEVYITPTAEEVNYLLELGCEVIALDGTPRNRPGSADLSDLITRIHDGGAIAMADCDTAQSAKYAVQCGADLIGTTLSGYTPDREALPGPDFELLRQIIQHSDKPVIAEGRYYEPWHARAALRMGATAVVVGGALNDPVKQTRAFLNQALPLKQKVGAVDIGGTWLRVAAFSPDWHLLESDKIELPPDPGARRALIRTWVEARNLARVGISTGGTVDPKTGCIWESKEIIPGNVQTVYDAATVGSQSCLALNDGHATAWGHAMHPKYAGKRVATLALGTGVGFGLVDRGQIFMGPRGEYSRFNDIQTSLGPTFEQLLGGAALTTNPDDAQKSDARHAADEAVRLIANLFHPDVIVLCGGVGMSKWLSLEALRKAVPQTKLDRSPFAGNAGLYGAAALALFPPI